MKAYEFTDDEWWDAYGVEFFRPDAPAIECVREAMEEIMARRCENEADANGHSGC